MGVTKSKKKDYAQNGSNPSNQIIEDIISRFLDDKFTISRSFQTRIAYSKAINKFLEFLTNRYNLNLIQFLSQVKETKQIDPIETLAEYRVFLTKYPRKVGKTGYSNITIRSYFSVAKEFLNRQGCKIYQEDLRQRITPLKITRTYEKGLTREIINRILRLSNPKLAATILMACSGGFRIGEIVQLRLSDIDFTKNPTEVRIRAATTKTRQTRITCLSSEATTALKDFISKSLGRHVNYGQDKYIFLKHHDERISELKNKIAQKKLEGKSVHLLNKVLQNWESELDELGTDERYSKDVRVAINSLESQLLRVIAEIPGLNEKNENGNNSIHFHAFRAFFKTQVTDTHQSDFAEALMGHTSVKLLYYRQNDKARAETYRQIEHAVTIADTEKLDQNITEIQEENQEFRKVIDSFSRQLRNMEKQIQESRRI